ncbi:hypothetical protein BKA00_007074 [Actinomadura coerulea]|uniref:Uncharacterized protein n=1 Tax=Actinomadura coerulea TaxID=46159 RepID=A0A7X0G618_9ACTN|nr:hypothetical protein [Actinomadura coerulea]MBB6400160.1 hypothetical protein [Actinomadura coerulea]GGQ22413.1 hypothetical protein GCM10010187_43630 [Actinomadura coerulea]
MADSQDRADVVLLTVDGEQVGHVHRSVLDRVAEIAGRLGCRDAVALACPPVTFDGSRMPRLRRDLEQVIAYAEAARQTGWVLGDIAVAPGDRAVPVMDTAQGKVWAHPVRGFELHGEAGVRRITELAEMPGTPRRTPLAHLIAPLVEAAARARVLEIGDGKHERAVRQG